MTLPAESGTAFFRRHSRADPITEADARAAVLFCFGPAFTFVGLIRGADGRAYVRVRCPAPEGHERDIYFGHLRWERVKGCAGCSGLGRPAGSNRPILDSEEAFLEMQRGGATPRVPFPGVMVPWESECNSCHNIIYPRLNDVKHHRQGACTFCAKYGHKMNVPNVVYNLVSSTRGAVKIGVTGTQNGSRLSDLLRLSLAVHSLHWYRNGDEAYKVEKRVKEILLEDYHLDGGFLSKEFMGWAGGYTETYSSVALPPEELDAVILRAAAELGFTERESFDEEGF